jgi:hypothetical protein
VNRLRGGGASSVATAPVQGALNCGRFETMVSRFDAPTLPPALVAFLRELAEALGDKVATQMRYAFVALSNEGLEVDDAENLLTALCRTATLRGRSLHDRIAVMNDLLRQKGRTVVHITKDDVSIIGRQN